MSDDKQLRDVFFVLSDPLRRRILEACFSDAGATVTELCNLFPISRFAVMRHLNILEETGFIRRDAKGRERHVFPTELGFEDKIFNWAKAIRAKRSAK
jgi:predicted transcriptional regulator